MKILCPKSEIMTPYKFLVVFLTVLFLLTDNALSTPYPRNCGKNRRRNCPSENKATTTTTPKPVKDDEGPKFILAKVTGVQPNTNCPNGQVFSSRRGTCVTNFSSHPKGTIGK
ncbi:hypothetical protein Fcan01_18407 [Folsomia candida]|uniref:Uncharacterized protein n=1 Tax=Folsomia candida TaxID=158441 RepID=A0A226DR42_FOLCA|nr:hypothetical protein Fcan01_18407 [Folsomia candida]